MDEISKIASYHPEIIYFPLPVKTWSGFLTVTCPSNANLKESVGINLVVPDYPKMTNLDVSFGPEIARLDKKKFGKNLNRILETATSVLILLQHIQTLIASMYPFDENLIVSEEFTKQNMIDQLNEVLLSSEGCSISSTTNLNEIILKSRGVSVRLRWKNDYWEVISTDFPDSLDFDIQQKKLPLKVIISHFLQCTEQMSEAWEQLKEIDMYCHVIDPVNPNPGQLYRRIYINDYLSVHITLDPMDATACPNIKFLGNQNFVDKFKTKLLESIGNWDSDITVYDNLLNLLEIDSFPVPEKVESAVSGCFNENDCNICFSLETDDGKIPEKMCSNIKCKRIFHTECLLRWLMGSGTNQIIFNDIYGKCPHCKETISCTMSE